MHRKFTRMKKEFVQPVLTKSDLFFPSGMHGMCPPASFAYKTLNITWPRDGPTNKSCHSLNVTTSSSLHSTPGPCQLLLALNPKLHRITLTVLDIVEREGVICI